MLDIGWPELLVVAIVLIVVVGPKDLPKMLRSFGRTTAKLRAMAGDFRAQFDEALKEAELDDAKSIMDDMRSMNPISQVKKELNPLEKVGQDIRAGLDAATKPGTTVRSPSKGGDPASTDVHAETPVKSGATAMPGESDTASPDKKADADASESPEKAKPAQTDDPGAVNETEPKA